MVYLYAPTLTPTAIQLLSGLGAQRLAKHDGMHFLRRGMPVEFSEGDTVVCWGLHVPSIPGVRILNSSSLYTNELRLNLGVGKPLLRAGVSQFVPQLVTPPVYKLSTFPSWPKRRPPYEVVSLPEFDGYVTRFHPYEKIEEFLIWNGEVLSGKDSEMCAAAELTARTVGMEFLSVWVGKLRGCAFVYKLRTAPELSSEVTQRLVERILTWVENPKPVVENVPTAVKQLLGE